MKQFSSTLNLILMWVLFSLLAIAFIGSQPFVGLAIAVIGGIVLGVFSFVDFEARQREARAKRQQEAAGAPEGGEDDEPDQDIQEPSLEGDSE